MLPLQSRETPLVDPTSFESENIMKVLCNLHATAPERFQTRPLPMRIDAALAAGGRRRARPGSGFYELKKRWSQPK
jgi:hypothetical protein